MSLDENLGGNMMSKKYFSLILFLLGFVIFMFTRRSEIVPTIQIAILIAPIFILRFIRTQPPKRGILLTLLGFLLSMNIALWGLFDMGDGSTTIIFNLIRSSILAILYFLPYMVDRLIYPKFKGKEIFSTLTFPIILTAIFFLSSLEGPFDGAGMSSKFVYGPLIFKQSISVFGIWIFVFISSWLASIINYSWENKFDWKKIKKMALILLSIILIILLFGAFKTTSLIIPKSDTVKIAAIVLIPEDGKVVSMERVFTNKLTFPFEKTISRIENLTKEAASNNAKIITFQEYTMAINEKDKDRLVDQYKRIAKENNIYLSITYAYFVKEGKGENKHLFIDNNGDIQLDYSKRYLFGFGNIGEPNVFKKGVEVIQITDTPYGRIGISICRDMDFPSYIRQAGRKNVDIMLGPSYDFPKSLGPGYWLRTIESGFSFVRPTYNGITFAADYNGNILAQMDSDQTEDGIMYADVPTKGIKTLYPVIGDLLGWLSVLVLLGCIVFTIKNKKPKTKEQS